MKLSSFVLAFLLSAATPAQGLEDDCSGQNNNFLAPKETVPTCITSWTGGKGMDRKYPDDYDGILNKVTVYRCPTSKKRVIISNGIPDHDLTQENERGPCEFPYAIVLPLDPVYDANSPKTEIPIRGIVAMAKNGVPTFGPQESDGLNAVETGESNKLGAKYWYGHAGGDSGWHVHNPQMGKPAVTTETFLGYAMDGFEIFGPLSDENIGDLDECNGRVSDDGIYRYHVRTPEQVSNNLDYCKSGYNNLSLDPVINWNYILGCYSGGISETTFVNSNDYARPDDCVVDPSPGGGAPIDVTNPPVSTRKRPNIIIMQPDDLVFMDEWGPPPNNPIASDSANIYPQTGMPNIEALRTGGLQMKQAYTASPVCGTSRFSTLTGKMPARAVSVREQNDSHPSSVTIPTTKLENLDCEKENLAQAFKDLGYATAMVGKWHLSNIQKSTYSYSSAVETIQECGFDLVGGLYIENLVSDEADFNNYSDGTFSHNMEWITHEAIKFINETTTVTAEKLEPDPFFLYFNPTVPHGSNDVNLALTSTSFTCKDTANGILPVEPWIKGMVEDEGCAAYRQTVVDRANGVDGDLGKIWLDDSVGALVQALKDNGVYENTIFLFQEDHGMDTKGALYENGVRIPQFVHYPDGIPSGTTLDVPVSTVDIAATMLDYAGVTSLPYNMDGKSWKDVIGTKSEELKFYWKNERCIFYEVETDRAVRCGCHKFLDIKQQEGSTYTRGDDNSLANNLGGMLFDLCDGGEDYITTNGNNREAKGNQIEDSDKKTNLAGILECYMRNTDPSINPVFDICGLAAPKEEIGRYELVHVDSGSEISTMEPMTGKVLIEHRIITVSDSVLQPHINIALFGMQGVEKGSECTKGDVIDVGSADYTLSFDPYVSSNEDKLILSKSGSIISVLNFKLPPTDQLPASVTDGNKYDICTRATRYACDGDCSPSTQLPVDHLDTRFTITREYSGTFNLENVNIQYSEVLEREKTIVNSLSLVAYICDKYSNKVDQSAVINLGQDFRICIDASDAATDSLFNFKIRKLMTVRCLDYEIIDSSGNPTNALTVVEQVDSSTARFLSVVQKAYLETGSKLTCGGKAEIENTRTGRKLEAKIKFSVRSPEDKATVSRGMQEGEEGSFGVSINIGQDEIDEAAGAGGNAGVATAATAAAFFVGILLV